MSLIVAGVSFPDWTLPLAEGGTRRIAETWAGGPGLVAIGHAGCGTTRLTLPYVERLHRRKGPGAGVMFVFQEDAAGAQALARQLGLTAPAGLDEHPYPLSAELGILTVPTLVLVAPDGVVAAVHEGWSRADMEALAGALGVDGALVTPADGAPPHRPG